jgi:peptidoglycan/LPS O-acetylase OafA/YrhL
MTVDFRDIEKIQRDAQAQKPDQDKSWANNLSSGLAKGQPGDPFFNPGTGQPAALAALASPANRKVVLLAMRAMAIVLLGAAMWILGSEPSWLEPAVAEVLGTALFIMGMADLILANILQKVWARQAAQRPD